MPRREPVAADPLDYPFWLASRSAGVVAYLLLSGSVVLGLAMSTRLAPRARRPRPARADRAAGARRGRPPTGCCCSPTAGCGRSSHEVLIPFTTGYRPLWTGLGILAAYGAVGLSLTYYARRRLGHRRWRNAHRFIPIAWALAAAHVIGAGTDVVSLWLQVVLAATIAAIVVLIVQRGLAGIGRSPLGGNPRGPEEGPPERSRLHRSRLPPGTSPSGCPSSDCSARRQARQLAA